MARSIWPKDPSSSALTAQNMRQRERDEEKRCSARRVREGLYIIKLTGVFHCTWNLSRLAFKRGLIRQVSG